jgi:hypothetical protein
VLPKCTATGLSLVGTVKNTSSGIPCLARQRRARANLALSSLWNAQPVSAAGKHHDS